MDFKDAYPDYVAIEEHIKRAHLERSLALAQLFADIADSSWKGLKKIVTAIGSVKPAKPAKPAALPFPSR